MSKIIRADEKQPTYQLLSSIAVDFEHSPTKGQKVYSLKRGDRGQMISLPQTKRKTKVGGGQPKPKTSSALPRAMVAEIEKEVQRKSEAVEREAYEQGFAQGEKAGRAIGEQQLAVAIRNVEQLVESLSKLKEELFQREEKQLIKLAYLIAEKVVHQRIEQDEEVALKIAEQVLLKTMREDKLRIQLNPQDEAMFKDRGTSVVAIAERLENLTIEVNPNVQRGGCIVTTPMGEIDATIDNQLYLVKNELTEDSD